MPDRIGRCSLITGIRLIIDRIKNPQALEDMGGLLSTNNENLSRKLGYKMQIMESRYTHNPTEETHKKLRYPYCG